MIYRAISIPKSFDSGTPLETTHLGNKREFIEYHHDANGCLYRRDGYRSRWPINLSTSHSTVQFSKSILYESLSERHLQEPRLLLMSGVV